MHLRFNFDACPMHSPFGFVHLTHQNLSARTLFCLNSLAKVNTQLLIYNKHTARMYVNPYTTEVSLEIRFLSLHTEWGSPLSYSSRFAHTPPFDPCFVKNPWFVCDVYLKEFLGLTVIQKHPCVQLWQPLHILSCLNSLYVKRGLCEEASLFCIDLCLYGVSSPQSILGPSPAGWINLLEIRNHLFFPRILCYFTLERTPNFTMVKANHLASNFEKCTKCGQIYDDKLQY